MAKKQLGTSPSVATDAATKGYVDTTIAALRNVQSVTAPTTLAANGDYIVFISGASGAVTMPTVVGNIGRYTIKNTHSSTKTISTTSSQLIDGTATLTLPPGDSVDLVSDGTAWRII